MRIWAEPTETPVAAIWWRAVVALTAAGLIARLLACLLTVNIAHPDEHQQYLEQAHRLVYGTGYQFWEQRDRIRHPLYHHLLALPLRLMKAAGLENPMLQAQLIRFLVSTAALLATAAFAWAWLKRGHPWAATIWLAIQSLTCDWVYLHSHSLTEVAVMVPMFGALLMLERRPFAAGLACGVAFALRFTSGFWIVGLYALLFALPGGRFSRAWVRFALGGLLMLLVMGGFDKLVDGEWFGSPWHYYRLNIVEGKAADFGVSPWWQYFAWLGWEVGWPAFVVLVGLLARGAIAEWRLAAPVALFALAHMATAHKEERFLFSIGPFALLFIVRALEEPWNWLAGRSTTAATALAGLLLVGLIVLREPAMHWNKGDFRPVAEILDVARRRSEAGRVGVMGLLPEDSPNYFYLRRDVPLEYAVADEGVYAQAWADDFALHCDLVVTRAVLAPMFGTRMAPVATAGEWVLLRRTTIDEGGR